MKTLTRLLCATLALILVSAAEAQYFSDAFLWQQGTGLQDLGSLGGYSVATGINDSGQVTGNSNLADNMTYHVFLWSAATGMVDLGTPAGKPLSSACGINSLGHVVGDGYDEEGNRTAFLWTPEDGFIFIGTDDQFVDATAVNDHDEVTGQFAASDGTGHTFIWSPQHGLRDLGALADGDSSAGYAINNHLEVAGSDADSAGDFIGAIVWMRHGGFSVVATSTGGGFVSAYGLNDRGEIVGTSGGVKKTQGFYIDTSGKITILQGLGGTKVTAAAINQHGMIAGNAFPVGYVEPHATLWNDAQSAPQDLGTFPGGFSSAARAINQQGQVVGFADGMRSP